MSGQASRETRSQRDRWFLVAFDVYVAIAVALLALGGVSVLAAAFPGLQDALHDWGAAGGPLRGVVGGLHEASHHASGPGHATIDYLFSVVNVALGVFVVRLRPLNWTARLLGIATVGTAAAFNMESHSLIVVLSDAEALVTNLPYRLHMVLHSVSGAAYLHALLAFPDGQLHQRWERRAVRVIWSAVGLESLSVMAFGGGPLQMLVSLPYLFAAGSGDLAARMAAIVNSPLEHKLAAIGSQDAFFLAIFFGLLIPSIGVATQVRRYRAAATGEERQQTRLLVWALVVAFGIGLVAVVTAITLAIGQPDPFAYFARIQGLTFRVFPPLFTIVPVALIVGVLRYRLWDVDLVINRALVYTLLTGALGVAYVTAVAALGLLLRPLTGGANDLIPILSTLAVAALFLPARRRIQATIDRRLYRARYDASRAVDDLAEQLGHRVDVTGIRDDVAGAVNRAFRPDHVSVWAAPTVPLEDAT